MFFTSSILLQWQTFLPTWWKRAQITQIVAVTHASDPDCYIYTENGSKNRSGGLWQLHVENKIVPIVANSELCHVSLLDEYISKLPQKAYDLDCFYMKPLGE